MALKVVREQNKVFNSPVGNANLSGIGQAGKIYANSLQGSIETADAVSQFAFEYGKQKKIEEAGAEAAVTEFIVDPKTNLPMMPDMPSTFTIYGAEYKKQMVNRYTNRVQTDIATTITKIASEFPTDPNGFAEKADSYLKETIKNVSPLARGLAESYASDFRRRAIGGIVNEQAKAVRAGAAKDENLANKSLRDNAVSSALNGDVNAFNLAIGNLESQLKSASPINYPTQGDIEEELASVRIDGAIANAMTNVSMITDPVKRLEAIDAFARGEGLLVNDLVKSANLSQDNYIRLQAQLKTFSVNMSNLQTATENAVVKASMTTSLFYYKDRYGIENLEKIGVSELLMAERPSVAMGLINRNERYLSREEGKESSKDLHSMLMRDIEDRVLGLPDASATVIRSAISKANNSSMNEEDKFRYVNSIVTKEISKLSAAVKANKGKVPIYESIAKSMETGTGNTLKQTTESGKTAEEVFRSQIARVGGDQDIESNPVIEDAAVLFTSQTGLIPDSLSQFIRNQANPMNPAGVVRAAYIVQNIRQRSPNAFSNNLSTAIGGPLLNDLLEFIDDGGLANGGLTNSAQIKRFEQRAARAYVQTKADMLAKIKNDLGDDDDNAADTNILIDEMFLAAMKGVHDDKNWSLFPENTQPTPAYRRAVLKTFQSMIPSDGISNESSYKNLMLNAIKQQQKNGWEDSLMSTPPGDNIIVGDNRRMVQYSPESTLTDSSGSSDWAIPKIEEFASKEYNKGQKKSKHIKFEFGKNMYLVPMGFNPVTKAPQFIINVVGNLMHRTLLDSNGQPVFVPAGEMLTERNNSQEGKAAKTFKENQEKLALRKKRLIEKQDKLYSGGVPGETTVMGGGRIPVQEAIDEVTERLNPVLLDMPGIGTQQ